MAEDTRILQLQFENQQFEKNIAKSQKSIEELKEAMDFEETSKGLEKFSRSAESLNFGRLESNLQKLTDKFTGLGEIGEYVLSRIRYTLESTARSIESFIRSITTDQIGVGESKYSALNKAVNTIIASRDKDTSVEEAESYAYGVMERVMAYTDQTSHSFQTMVGQISNLKSVGVGLEDAEKFLEGVANAATHAGKGASEAASSMAILSKIMGSGSLNKIQFDSLNQTYGVITSTWRELAIEAGLAAGTLKKSGDKIFTNVKGAKKMQVTVGNLENTFTQGKWFNSDVAKILYGNYQFGDTIDDLKHPERAVDSFGKTAYLTGQKALTLADAFNAVKESVSSGWMQSFRLILGDVTEASEHFTSACERLIDILDKIATFRNALLRGWAGAGGRESLMDNLFGDYWRDTETGAYGLLDMVEGLGKIVKDGLIDFLSLFGNPEDRALMKSDDDFLAAWFQSKFEKINEKVQKFMQGIRDFFNEKIDVNGKMKTRLEVVQEIVSGISGALKIAWDILVGVSAFVLKLVEQLGPSIDDISGFLSDLGKAIYGTAEETSDGNKIINFFKTMAEKLKPATDGINLIIHGITRLLRLLFGLDDEGTEFSGTFGTIGEVFTTIADVIGKVAGPILTFIGNVLNLLADLFKEGINKDSIAKFGKGLSDAFLEMMKSFADNLPDSLGFISDFIRDVFGLWDDQTEEQAKERSKTLGTAIHKIFTEGLGGFGGAKELFGQFFSGFSLTKALDTGFGFKSAMNFLGMVSGALKGTNLYTVLMMFFGVATLFELFTLVRNVKKAVRTIGGFFDDVGTNLKQGILGEYEWFSERFLRLAEAIGILVGCVVLLGSMKTSSLIAGVLALIAVIAAFGLFFKWIKDFKATNFNQYGAVFMLIAVAGSMAALCIALSVLALALIPLSSSPEKMITAVLGLAAILTAFGVFITVMMKSMNAFIGIQKTKVDAWNRIGQLAVILLLITISVSIIAKAMSVLMVAMAPLALVGWQGMLGVALVFAAVLTAIGFFLVLVMKAMKDITGVGNKGSWKNILSIGAMLILISAAVAIIVTSVSVLMLAMAPLAATGWLNMLTVAGVFVVVLAAIGAFIIIMLRQMDDFVAGVGGGSTNAKGLAKTAAMLLILSATVSLLAGGIAKLILALIPLALMGWEGMIRAVLGLGIIMLELGLLISYIQKMSVGDKAISVKIAGLAGFAVSIGLLVLALTPLALISWEGWAKMMAGLAVILVELVGYMALMSFTLKKMKIGGVEMGGFIAFAASIAILVFALKPLAAVTWEGWAKMVAGLAVVLIELVGYMFLMSLMLKKMKIGAVDMGGFIGFAASIAILIFALKPLSEMTPQGYAQALVGLMTVLIEVAAILALMKIIAPDVKTGLGVLLSLVSVSVLLIAFSIALNEVKDIPTDKIMIFAAAVSLLVISIAAASLVFGAVGFKGILMMALGVAAFLGVIALMADLVLGSIGSAISRLGAHLAVFATLMQTFSDRMSGVDDSSVDRAIEIVKKIASLFGYLLTFSTATGNVKAFNDAMSKLILAAIKIQSMTERFESITPQKMTQIGNHFTAIKRMLEGPISACSEYLARAQLFSSVMYELGTGAEIFNNHTSSITSDPADNKGLALIQALAGCANDLDTISKLKLTSLTSNISGLGGAMMLYAQGAKEATGLEIGDTPDVTAAVTLMTKISEALNENGGFTIPANFPDESSLGNFGAQLAALAGALIQFEQAGSGLGDGTEEALKTLDFFVDLKNKLVEKDISANLTTAMNTFKDTNGVMMESNELEQFGKNIEQLGLSMKSFALSTSQLDEETGEMKPVDYTLATTAMESISQIATKLPSIGGLKELIEGKKQSLGDLASSIVDLSGAMNELYKQTTIFNTETNSYTPYDYSHVQGFLESLVEMDKKLPYIGGINLRRLVVGDQMTLGQLGVDIGELGAGLNVLTSNITGTNEDGSKKFDADAAQEAAGVVTNGFIPLIGAIKELPNVGGIWGFIQKIGVGDKMSLKDMADQIGQMGSGLAQFSDAVAGKFQNSDEITTAMTVVKGFAEMIAWIATFEGLHYSSNMVTYFENLNLLLDAFINGFKKGDDDYDKAFDLMDKIFYVMSWISKNINSYGEIDNNALASFATMMEILSKISQIKIEEGGEANFLNVGLGIAAGVASGIEQGTSNVINAAVDMAVKAYEAAKTALDEHSPSRIFMGLGEYIGLGMAKGIDNSSVDAADSATGLSEETIVAAKAAIDAINQMFAEGVETGPMITPVLDLSQMEAGMSQLNGGFGGRKVGIDATVSTALAGNVNPQARNSDSGRQNAQNLNGVYERMNALGNQLQKLGESVKNMKIVLDSGVLVGSVSDGVDNELGKKIFYGGRRN